MLVRKEEREDGGGKVERTCPPSHGNVPGLASPGWSPAHSGWLSRSSSRDHGSEVLGDVGRIGASPPGLRPPGVLRQLPFPAAGLGSEDRVTHSSPALNEPSGWGLWEG